MRFTLTTEHKKLLVTTFNPTHRKWLITSIFLLFFLIGGIVGYGFGLTDSADTLKAYDPPVNTKRQKLLQLSEEVYVNPFNLADAKNLAFPIDRLGNCRNWSECHDYCSQPVHFPACSAWALGEGLIR